MRRYFFEILTVVLFTGSMMFFWKCIGYLARRDYVGAILLTCIGMSVIAVGKEMARLALVQNE